MTDALLLAGTSHPALANQIAHFAAVTQGQVYFCPFPDHELYLHLQDNVRGKEVFVVQSIVGRPNDFLMEMLMLMDALKRASAKQIIAVIPYFGYARQDRKDCPRGPITARLVADLLTTAGASHLVSMDLHADQIQGFFDIPVDALHAWPLLVQAVQQMQLKNLVVVAPDLGAIKLAHVYAEALGVDFAVMDKRRYNAQTVQMGALIGNVKGRTVLLVDDMCATGQTLAQAALTVKKAGATQVFAACTHGVLVADARSVLEKSVIEKIFLTDTIPFEANQEKIQVVSVASIFAEAVKRILLGESISSIFQ